MFPNKLIIAFVAGIAILGGSFMYGYKAGGNSVRADAAIAVQAAVKKARAEEQVNQGKVNELAKAQYDELFNINNDLNDNLNRLRNRPSRRNVPDNPETFCQGASGADLSKPDAEFLTRLAARADTLRTALKACYQYADTVSH